ncbi:hypothetical protein N0V83_002562 [Neocucurbitaria cava]|uniref:SRR1-like domain-containing protein n=1 Tax=Neocucurbitaria cava TaxID=798079 RepID=A0A9W8YDX4_9PLEO|nr:hypothetical protein N0V83_002562 [Neocucurbitaria cava]
MPTSRPLTDLYDRILRERQGRVWTIHRIVEAEKLQQKIDKFNKKSLLQHSLDSGQEQGVTADEELRADVFQLNSELEGFGPGAKYKSSNVFGVDVEREIESFGDLALGGVRCLLLVMEGYWSIAKGLSADSTKEGDAQLLYKIIARNATRHQNERSCHDDTTAYSYWKKRWNADVARSDDKVWIRTKYDDLSENYKYEFVSRKELTDAKIEEDERIKDQWHNTRKRLIGLLMTHKDKLKHVKNVLCFGLGALDWRRPRSFVQHLAAATIRDTLNSLQQRGPNEGLQIIAQDPAYCSNCTSVLKSELSIEAVTSLKGFKEVTRNSFIITVAPSAPVCQIITDLTLDDGGPAAMLCDRFGDDYLAQERTREGALDALDTSDEPTKNMVEYKKRCVIEGFEDRDELPGMSYDEYKKYPTVQALRKELELTNKEIILDDKRETKTIDKDKIQKDNNWCDMSRREATWNFPESALYVRVD